MKNVFTKKDEPADYEKIIAFVHHKGGTGKTTACLNVAGWLAKMGKKVLVVDLDPQGNATSGLGIDRRTCEASVYDVFFARKNLEDVVLETNSGVYLAPSSLDLLAAETHMAGRANNAVILKEHLGAIEASFDYILIDVPPASTLLMINGVVAAGNIIIPLDTGVFAYETMDTLKTVVIDLYEELRVEVNVMALLLRECSVSIFDKVLTYRIKSMLRKFLIGNRMPEVKIFVIPFSRAIYRAQVKGEPISHYAPYSDVGRVYRGIAKKILVRK